MRSRISTSGRVRPSVRMIASPSLRPTFRFSVCIFETQRSRFLIQTRINTMSDDEVATDVSSRYLFQYPSSFHKGVSFHPQKKGKLR